MTLLLIEQVNLLIGAATSIAAAMLGAFWGIRNVRKKIEAERSAREDNFEGLYKEMKQKYIDACEQIIRLNDHEIEASNLLVYVKRVCPDCYKAAKTKYDESRQ